MSREILDSRRQVVSAVIRAYPGGRESAAARLGLKLKQFDNHAYENNGHRPLDDGQIALLESDTGTTYLPDYLCSLYGGFYVSLPDVDTLDNVELHQRGLQTSTKRGRVDQFIAQALSDGEIDEQEASEILALHAKHMAARHAEVVATINLHKRGKR
ncbi:YmfL family putative regulatory protein [Halopseudomonas phragmitis]|uniref:Uncharacterized protein n=1 Tax=Halopseudomonas phragmitis TaxID=1931241 RepID=A0A1V0B673_9GAMM|nr:YmfL family putative regulatory protein [Halopseudomonas phragmitis]AQZ95443.1 hypothetical protein BVH74_12090 [Halopseudomonas phragmitis]